MSTTLLPPTTDDYVDEGGLAWREPVGFDGYLVSFLGHVRAFTDARFPNGRLLNPPTGRVLVHTDTGHRTTRSMARLVMLAWHTPAPTPTHTAGHLNGVKTDNRAVNLFWESRPEQNARARYVERPHCPRGHSYSGDNLFVNRKGHNCCRICYRSHWWASKYRRQLAQEPFDGRLCGSITVEVILALAPDGRFPHGAPPLSTIRAEATRQQRNRGLARP